MTAVQEFTPGLFRFNAQRYTELGDTLLAISHCMRNGKTTLRAYGMFLSGADDRKMLQICSRPPLEPSYWSSGCSPSLGRPFVDSSGIRPYESGSIAMANLDKSELIQTKDG